MTRVNSVLCLILIACGIGLVSSQHQARKLFVELQKQQERAVALEVEYGQLQLEQSTWAMHSRIERIASRQLRMRVPPAARVRVVPPPPAPSKP
ncbi:MAG: cell division protein FtsL [Burkholderiales bacterium]